MGGGVPKGTPPKGPLDNSRFQATSAKDKAEILARTKPCSCRPKNKNENLG
jgi:hypothetical protein